MRLRAFAVALVAGLACVSCASHVPSPSGPPGVPRVGWVLMHGDRDNPDREYACQSTDAADCVVPASRPDASVFTALYVYYHPTPAETKYTGTIQIGFFSGDQPHELRPNVTVKANGPPGNQSVTAVASQRPGNYLLRIAVDAAPKGADVRQIREQVLVTVR